MLYYYIVLITSGTTVRQATKLASLPCDIFITMIRYLGHNWGEIIFTIFELPDKLSMAHYLQILHVLSLEAVKIISPL